MTRSLVLSALVTVASIAACATYSAEPGKGSIGDACDGEATCQSDLVCVARVCEKPEAPPTDASSNVPPDTGAPVDSGGELLVDSGVTKDAAPDVAKPAPCDALASGAPAGVVDCVDVSCLPGKICCSTGHTCTTSCSDFQVAMPCDGKDDCPMGNVCCGDLGNAINSAVCPRSGSFTKLKTRCAASCSGAEVELCTAATCPAGQRCTRVLAQLGAGGGANFNVNYCE